MKTQAQKRLAKWTYRKCCEVLYVSAERDRKPKERRIKTKDEFRAVYAQMKGASAMIDNAALKACPFCGGKAKWRYIKPQGYVFCVKCGTSTGIYSDTYEEADCKTEAIAAWNRRAEPANEPLTFDQLRGMNGEPVWCVDAKGRGIWALVHTRDEVCMDADFGDWEFYCYGWMDGGKLNENGWLAYKGKPEGGER